MIRCSKCGHENLPSFPSCSKCGTSLVGGAPAPVPDEYAARFAAERAAAARRKRTMFLGAALAALGVFAWRWFADAQRKGDAQAKLDFAGRWVELEKREMGLVWSCVMASEVDIGMFSNANQIQQKIEDAYRTQQKTFSEHLLTECVPKMERARQAFGSLTGPPAEFKAPLESYLATLPELQKGIEVYADRIKNRGVTKSLDQLIQEAGSAWHSEASPTAQTIAFERFMHCAVPGLASMKDAQQMLEYLADACYKKDPVQFMDRVRSSCGPLLESPDAKATPSKTYKLSQKRFYEEDARQLQAWDSCGRRANKGKKVEDLGELLTALGNYMKARFEVKKAAQALEDASS
jgi:zinc-ribbon domain